MEKEKLYSIVKKYYLGGEINTVKFVIENFNLNIDFGTSSKDLIGNLKYKKFPIQDEVFAIYDTRQLIKLIEILDKELELSIIKDQTSPPKLQIKDSKFKQIYFLSDPILAPKVGTVKTIEDFDATLNISEEHLVNLIKAKNALPDSEELIIMKDGKDVKFIFGDDNNFSNKVEYKIKAELIEGSNFKLPFNSNLFKQILESNKDISQENSILKIHHKGLLYFNFKHEDLETTYYLLRKN